MKCGLNSFADAEKNQDFQKLCGKAILEAVDLDSKFRDQLAQAVFHYNAGQKIGEELRENIIKLRSAFATELGVVKILRTLAISAINAMELALAVSKITTAGHQMAK